MASTDKMLRIKLVNMFGDEAASKLITEVLGEIQITALITAQDRYNFGTRLTQKGGVFESLGKSIQVQAILFGAREPQKNGEKTVEV